MAVGAPPRSWSWHSGRAAVVSLAVMAFGCADHTARPSAPTPFDGVSLTDACTLPSTSTAESIPAFVSSLTHPYAYTPLTLDQRNGVAAATRALDQGDLASASQSAGLAGYRIAPLKVQGECYVLLQPTDAAPAGQALLVYATRWERDLVLEAPHVPEDHRTGDEAALLFVQLRPKAMVIAGAHRCAVRAPSGCKASTECGSDGIAVESDASHAVTNAVNAMHLAFRTTSAVIVQLHTNFKPSVNGDILVSNGTHYPIAGTPADALYAALKGRMSTRARATIPRLHR